MLVFEKMVIYLAWRGSAAKKKPLMTREIIIIIIIIIIVIIIIIIIDIYKAQYPLIAQSALQYNNMVKNCKVKYTVKTIIRYKKID